MLDKPTFDELIEICKHRIGEEAAKAGLMVDTDGRRVGVTAHRFDCINQDSTGYFLVSQEPNGRLLLQAFKNEMATGDPIVIDPYSKLN